VSIKNWERLYSKQVGVRAAYCDRNSVVGTAFISHHTEVSRSFAPPKQSCTHKIFSLTSIKVSIVNASGKDHESVASYKKNCSGVSDLLCDLSANWYTAKVNMMGVMFQRSGLKIANSDKLQIVSV
jgi:hypothetical protein